MVVSMVILNSYKTNGVYLPNSSLVISDLKANDYELGELNAQINGNQSLTNYNVDVTLNNDGLKSLRC